MLRTALLCALLPFLLAAQPTPPRPTTPPVLPPGFTIETVISGLRGPSAFAFAPDGRIFVLERGSATSEPSNVGAVRVVKSGRLLDRAALTLEVCGEGERGLLGIAVDPDFAHNGWIYLYATRRAASGPPCGFQDPNVRNRVSRFTMRGDTIDPRSERVLIDSITSMTSLHNAGDLHFDGAGHLFISVGDNDLPRSPAPDLSSLLGKVLRIEPLGGDAGGYSIPDDNPFAKADGARQCGKLPPGVGSGPCKEVWAYGLRNPFRISVDSQTGDVYAFDVGVNAWEEIDRIEAGHNYGYPQREAWCERGVICGSQIEAPGLTAPIWAYAHLDGGSGHDSSIIGGPLYRGHAYPEAFRGSLFFGDWVRGFIRRLSRDGNVWKEHEFATDLGPVLGIATGPDGNLYFIDYADESDNLLRRFLYRP